GYATLDAAWSAAVTGDVLVLNQDVTLTKRLGCDNREITLKSSDNAIHRIIRDAGNKGNMLFLANTNASNVLTLENVIIDGNNVSSTVSILEASNHGVVNLKNVEVVNAVTNKNQGFFCVKSNGYLHVDGLKMTNSSVTYEGRGDVFVGSNTVDIKGDCEFSAYLENNNHMIDGGVNPGSAVTLLFEASRVDNMTNPLVTTASSVDNYICGLEGNKLINTDDNLYVVPADAEVPDEPTAVVNETNGKGYSGLDVAWDAAASGDVLVLNEPATVSARLNSNGRTITIKSGDDAVQTITRDNGYTGLLFLPNNADGSNGEIILDNVIIDGNNVGATVVESSHHGTVTLRNAVIRNVGAADCVISVKNSGGAGNLVVESLTIEDCN
ncbi:MAG: hypothetical protein K2H49_00390, partial [Muribaculaceae bacterium]|nr:hypothetical protein [Muribaculaceae bacterium]